jgi:hypothetical protein
MKRGSQSLGTLAEQVDRTSHVVTQPKDGGGPYVSLEWAAAHWSYPVVPFKRLIKRRLAPMVKKIGRHERVSLKLVENLDKVLTEIAR